MRRRQIVSIPEALARRTDEYRRASLIAGYRELANDVRELWPLANHPNPPAPRLTAPLAMLESLSGRTPPADVLSARDVLAIATTRSLA